MELNTLRDLYIEQLKDLYSAETQIIQAMPAMAAATTSSPLRTALNDHLEETKAQLERLKQIGQMMGEDLSGHLCKGTQGILAEGKELLEERKDADPEVLDAGIITSVQRMEHYEIAGYGTTVAYAKQLGETEAEALLQQSNQEEHNANNKLTEIALASVNPAAE